MKTRDSICKGPLSLAVIILALAGSLAALPASHQEEPLGKPAAKEELLYSFMTSQSDGRTSGGLVSDSAGNLYGATSHGGRYGGGTVFELTLQSGRWTEKVLHDFRYKGGVKPVGNLILDKAGNIYGTTLRGGSSNSTACYGTNNCGIIYELSPQAGDYWAETVLHSFAGYPLDGMAPMAGLVFDDFGNLYGTTLMGGKRGAGTVFELSPQPGGSWAESIVHSFKNDTDSYGALP
jgi:uncharacterized repeat protein (TIGR03803 family)